MAALQHLNFLNGVQYCSFPPFLLQVMYVPDHSVFVAKIFLGLLSLVESVSPPGKHGILFQFCINNCTRGMGLREAITE